MRIIICSIMAIFSVGYSIQARPQVLTGDDIVLTDISPTIAYDDTDSPGYNWVVRGDNGGYSIFDDESDLFLFFANPGSLSLAVGYEASTSGNNSLAVGRDSEATGNGSAALGTFAVSAGTEATSVGYSASASGNNASALGYATDAAGSSSISLGYFASSEGNYSIALGMFADSSGEFSTALGSQSEVTADQATALGFRAFADQPNTLVLGSVPGVNSAATYANAGFGTTNPIQAVDVERSGAAARFQLTSYTNTANEAPQYIQRRARGTRSAPTAVQANDNLGLFSFRGYNGATMGGSRATITAQAAGNFSGSSTPTRLIFATTPVGQTVPQQVLVITPDGQVKINGQNLNVPDYVFEEDYELMPLDELRTFIDENGHLPGIASADEVATDGHDLAGSDMAHLRKIEELTLYTLQQETHIEQQRLLILDQQARLVRVERQLQAILDLVQSN